MTTACAPIVSGTILELNTTHNSNTAPFSCVLQIQKNALTSWRSARLCHRILFHELCHREPNDFVCRTGCRGGCHLKKWRSSSRCWCAHSHPCTISWTLSNSCVSAVWQSDDPAMLYAAAYPLCVIVPSHASGQNSQGTSCTMDSMIKFHFFLLVLPVCTQFAREHGRVRGRLQPGVPFGGRGVFYETGLRRHSSRYSRRLFCEHQPRDHSGRPGRRRLQPVRRVLYHPAATWSNHGASGKFPSLSPAHISDITSDITTNASGD